MYETMKVKVIGAAPGLIMHNGHTADPLNPFAIKMKEINGKRKKTEADHEEISRVEFQAGLYIDKDGPCLPAELIMATVINGARKSKLGKLVEAGVYCARNASLQYDGPRDWKALFADPRFVYRVPVAVMKQKVMRTRPIFREWSAELELSYLPDVINKADLLTAVGHAGALVGFGDRRPMFGRFSVESDVQQAIPMAAE